MLEFLWRINVQRVLYWMKDALKRISFALVVSYLAEGIFIGKLMLDGYPFVVAWGMMILPGWVVFFLAALVEDRILKFVMGFIKRWRQS